MLRTGGRAFAAACVGGFVAGYSSLRERNTAHAEAIHLSGHDKYMMAGADGPEWASHVLGKRPWSVHTACIAANAPIEDRIVVDPCAEGVLVGVLDGHYG
eukprot:CAMPEP_0169468554 /NCGR_PEP_ID=MMETSP1042-20121227/22977_1 /TAXON_ID=464988 /ORGANISM="Hemiselmis andersenii, Strain CCMP1180" /LENGTH=99 /DNA_ID=CAMNT_0009581909 /DNA_START=18 /DNA_END=313 /DNA_ORIENTATION=+